jgi:shikimate kinase
MKTSPPRIISITGFMGAGKTTVAQALARRLSCDLLDLDQLIETQTGRAPHSVIDEDGEPRFRELETQALRRALERATPRAGDTDTADAATTPASVPLIIALGGGTWTLERNRDLLSDADAFTVWLDAPFQLCWQRIINQQAPRPLARDLEGARRLYEARRASYSLARMHLRVTAETTPQALAERIATALSSC